jgi:uncharacterized membrane protein YebE (DUF533 family)
LILGALAGIGYLGYNTYTEVQAIKEIITNIKPPGNV